MLRTEVVVVMDRSGSMVTIADDAAGGFNQLVRKQQEVLAGPGSCKLTLVQFDTEYEFVHRSCPIEDIPEFKLHPRGGTALLDALGRAIKETEHRMPSVVRCDHCGPTRTLPKVIFVVVTDGHENSSKEFSKAQISALVEAKQREGWEFVFLGANVDAFTEAGAYSIPTSLTLQYKGTARSVRASYDSVCQNLTNVRTGASATMAFTDEQRAEALRDED
jgi:hypothetical protein